MRDRYHLEQRILEQADMFVGEAEELAEWAAASVEALRLSHENERAVEGSERSGAGLDITGRRPRAATI
eukprot:gene2273-2029_t